MKKVTRLTLIADILEMYALIEKGVYKEPKIRYTEKQLKQKLRGELQLLMAEMLGL